MKPRAMSVWISAAASIAVRPPRSVQARASVGPIVKKVIRPSESFSLRATSSSADAPSRNAAASSSESSASSASSWRSMPPGPVLDDDHRLRRQRLERVRDLAAVVGDRPARLDVREQGLEPVDLLLQLRVARLRLLPGPLEALLDVVAVGDEQLELERLARRPARAGVKPSSTQSSASTWRRLPSRPARCRARPGRGSWQASASPSARSAASCSSRSSAIGAMPTCGFASCTCAPACVSALNSVVLPDFGQPDDS